MKSFLVMVSVQRQSSCVMCAGLNPVAICWQTDRHQPHGLNGQAIFDAPGGFPFFTVYVLIIL